MSVALDLRMWPPNHTTHPSYLYPATHSPYHVLPPKNHREMNREMLIIVLEYMSTLLEAEFGGLPIRLVAHGGACMLLHPGLYDLARRKAAYHSSRGESVPARTTTRDVDYIRRSFMAEYVGTHKILDAEYRMQRCIRTTALKFGLGADWMNADADVALPMSTSSSGAPYDPIYHASLQPFNIKLYTVFTSKNKKLTIINVTPAWAVALKLIRYAKWDPGDISLLLMNGTNLAKVHWTAQVVKSWILKDCSAMGYDRWDVTRLLDMDKKIEHAVQMVTSIGTHLPPTPEHPSPSHTTNNGTPSHASRLGSTPVPSDEQNSFFIPPDPTTSHSSSLRPLGPSVSLDSSSQHWKSVYAAAEDDQVRTSRKKKEKKKRDGHQSRRSVGEGFNSVYDLSVIEHALPDSTNHHIHRSRSAEFDVSATHPFAPNETTSRIGSKTRPNTRERHTLDKHADRKKDKQQRERAREHDRRLKLEGRDTFVNYSMPDRRPYLYHQYRDEPESDSSDTEEETSDRPLEYVPMPKPPAEVFTPEWEAERKQQEAQWAEEHLRGSAASKENRGIESNQYNSPSRSQRHHHDAQNPPARNHDLMMSIYSPPIPPQPPYPALPVSPPARDYEYATVGHRNSFTLGLSS